MPVKESTKRTNRPKAKLGVIRRRLRDESTRQIAKAEGIARNTVIRILSLPEVRMAVAECRSTILGRMPELAIRLVQIALGETKKGDRQALVDLLRGMGVLTTRHTVEDATDQNERDYAYPRVIFFEKYGRWPSLEEAKEFDKTLEVKPLIKGEDY
jgi:hypothetical protein